MKKILLAFFLLVLALAATTYWYLSAHGFSARVKPLAVEALIARNLRRLAIPTGSKEMRNPVTMTDLKLAEARDHFADHCALCHANNGSGETEINSGLYPPAPDLRSDWTQGLSDGEIFYIIKNGIRFTGMPGWGGEDEENWQLVSFIRYLPRIRNNEIQYMKEINGLDK